MKAPHARTTFNMKGLSIFAGLLVVLVAATGVVFAPDLQGPTGREITIVAEDMTFLLTAPTSAGQANPTITVKAGQKITIVLRNDDPGMLHDLLVQGQEIRTQVISYGETTRLTFTAPREPGTYVYMCSFHPISMRGTLIVE